MLFHSSSPVVPDSLCRLTNASEDMLVCAERIFWNIVHNEVAPNVFLNVPNLFEVLTFLATVGNAESSRVIKEQLFKVGGKGDGSFYSNENHDKLLCETVAHDLQGWDQRILNECTDHEYISHRRLYMNRKACRSYSYATVQAMNSMSIEWKISAGTGELAKWAYGDPMIEGKKCPFTIWKHDDENTDPVEERRDRIRKERKGRKHGLTLHKVANTTHKCPLIITSSSFRIPVHPLLVDGTASYRMHDIGGAQVKALRFVNDTTKMMGYRKMAGGNGVEPNSCAVLPCRNIKDNTTMKLIIFWGATLDINNIMQQVTAVVGGGGAKHDWTVEDIHELQLPVWDPPTDAVNLADPICQSISDHVFSEGSFGDLAESGVTPCVLGQNEFPPAVQAFDALSVRTPADDNLEVKMLHDSGMGIIRVPLPYLLVVYDDTVKMPIYLGRIKDPIAYREVVEKTGPKSSCTIL